MSWLIWEVCCIGCYIYSHKLPLWEKEKKIDGAWLNMNESDEYFDLLKYQMNAYESCCYF